MVHKKIKKTIPYFIMTILFLLGRCDKITEPNDPGKITPNIMPETTICNVPLENTAENPYFYNLTMNWDGGDEDGYIVGYKYKIDDEDWIFTQDVFLEYDFGSPDSVNFHTFQVKAVDDAGGEDPTPAIKQFYTKQTYLPETEIISAPAESKSYIILKDTTSLWKGIEFSLSGTDEDGKVVAYQYCIDDSTNWTQTQKSTIYIFGDLSDGEHLFLARAVDNAKGIDPTPVRSKFSVINPILENKILIVDETRNGTGSAASPNDEMVDEFYRHILADFGFDEYDMTEAGSIDAKTFARYEIVVWHDDDRSENILKEYIEDMKDYLKIGGKLILSGWRTLENVDNILSEEYYYSTTDFGYEFLKMEAFKYNKSKDFIGAIGVNGYPDMATDPNKMLASYEGKLNYCSVLIPFDESNTILTFDSSLDDPEYEGLSCGLHYISDAYKVVATGFPLYVMQENAAKAFIHKAIGEFRN